MIDKKPTTARVGVAFVTPSGVYASVKDLIAAYSALAAKQSEGERRQAFLEVADALRRFEDEQLERFAS